MIVQLLILVFDLLTHTHTCTHTHSMQKQTTANGWRDKIIHLMNHFTMCLISSAEDVNSDWWAISLMLNTDIYLIWHYGISYQNTYQPITVCCYNYCYFISKPSSYFYFRFILMAQVISLVINTPYTAWPLAVIFKLFMVYYILKWKYKCAKTHFCLKMCIVCVLTIYVLLVRDNQ